MALLRRVLPPAVAFLLVMLAGAVAYLREPAERPHYEATSYLQLGVTDTSLKNPLLSSSRSDQFLVTLQRVVALGQRHSLTPIVLHREQARVLIELTALGRTPTMAVESAEQAARNGLDKIHELTGLTKRELEAAVVDPGPPRFFPGGRPSAVPVLVSCLVTGAVAAALVEIERRRRVGEGASVGDHVVLRHAAEAVAFTRALQHARGVDEVHLIDVRPDAADDVREVFAQADIQVAPDPVLGAGAVRLLVVPSAATISSVESSVELLAVDAILCLDGSA